MPSSTPGRKFKVEPMETTTKSSRRFAPQPIETTTKSSRPPVDGTTAEAPPKRRFVPQPIETSASSTRWKEDGDRATTKPRKFIPQLVESTTSRRHHEDEPASNDTTSPKAQVASVPTPANRTARRKFAPQLIDTAKRTRKAGDTRPAHLPSDRTDAMPSRDIDGIRRFRPQVLPPPPDNTPASALSPVMSSAEARRLGIPLPKRLTSTCSFRQHSFRVPDLERIDSSESDEESDPPSLSTSASSSSDLSYQMYKHATRMRESIDATSSGYLLELAAKAADRQLREQALAAFPNDDRHTPVDHYIDRDSEESTAVSTRSELDHRKYGSFNWELKDMRQHHDQVASKKEKEQAHRESRHNRARKPDDKSPWDSPFQKSSAPVPWQKDAEMERMRKKARPPMLGGDIEFPRCESPAPARFDVTQGSYSVRTAMCYLTEQTEVDTSTCDAEGLWAKKETKEIGCGSLWSRSSSRAPSPGGLWAGCCRGSALTPPRGPTGLMTPHIDDDGPNPMESADANHLFRQLPPSPPPSNSGMASLDDKLETEQALEAEFSDAFVTQVYNYLSLGYPSLARKYDDELSKISRISLPDLRQDDGLTSARGYIRLGEDECAQDGIEEETCARWKALRLYIHEWARQQPRMSQQKEQLGGFGVTVRRGSWAW